MNIQAIYNILTNEDKEQLRLLLDNEEVNVVSINRLPSQAQCDARVINKMNKRNKR